MTRVTTAVRVTVRVHSLAAIDQIVKTDTDWVYPPEILIEFTVVKIILFCRCIVLKLFPSIR